MLEILSIRLEGFQDANRAVMTRVRRFPFHRLGAGHKIGIELELLRSGFAMTAVYARRKDPRKRSQRD
ncbi:MAG TPA: hypothetical protein VMV78_12935 [Thiobacillus sp.]|jgi:hypothetical protein|nr:hypothetical protein [Thiobacillus sp.]